MKRGDIIVEIYLKQHLPRGNFKKQCLYQRWPTCGPRGVVKKQKE